MGEEEFHKENTVAGAKKGDDSSFPKIPDMIGPYRITSLLEKGGMSVLYLGVHPETKDPITIKVLSPQFVSNAEVVQRFLKEAEIIAMTDHPNIVKLYGHGEWEGGLYIAMEFVQGISLRQYLEENPISLQRALQMIIDIAYALCHLHTHGVIHRDLKPENILVTESGDIKVIDFGIAQLLTEAVTEGGAPKMRLIGTPIYMSPEQRKNPEQVSFPSDIYSLGIIAYELILGKLSHGHIHLSLMPKGIYKILSKALQPSSKDRYQDIVDFITELSGYLNSKAFQKEKKKDSRMGTLSEDLADIQRKLMPISAPSWPHLEIGVARYRGVAITGAYFEFFDIAEDIYGIVMGAMSSPGPKGLVDSASIRGMIRALCKLTTKPVELVTLLNDILVKDLPNQIFPLTYLILKPRKNQYSYISCSYGGFWQLTKSNPNPEWIPSENPTLGADSAIEFFEVSHPWNPGDTLLLHSFPGTDLGLEHLKAAISDVALLPPQQQAQIILRRATTSTCKSLPDRPLAVISIKRQEI